MIPLYGFLEGDTIGLLLFAYEEETVRELSSKLQQSASLRVRPKNRVRVLYQNRVLDPGLKVSEVGFQSLGRLDVIEDRS